MQVLHRWMRTWTRCVDRYVALSEFSREKYIAGGLPAERISLKPNFLPVDPGCCGGERANAIFVGRLSEEKGLAMLLAAWQRVTTAARLLVVGDGPLAPLVRQAAAQDARIEWLGHRVPADVLDLVGRAACLVLPSTCYENFPRTILEAYAKGTPVVASRRGSMRELVDDGRTGFHFAPGDAQDLAVTLDKFLGLNAAAMERMRDAARQEFERKYSAERNHDMLREIYELALQTRNAAGPQLSARAAPQPVTVRSSTAALEPAGTISREVWP
jgi:glycosyltransferase involved in cell wall biosynthesis